MLNKFYRLYRHTNLRYHMKIQNAYSLVKYGTDSIKNVLP